MARYESYEDDRRERHRRRRQDEGLLDKIKRDVKSWFDNDDDDYDDDRYEVRDYDIRNRSGERQRFGRRGSASGYGDSRRRDRGYRDRDPRYERSQYWHEDERLRDSVNWNRGSNPDYERDDRGSWSDRRRRDSDTEYLRERRYGSGYGDDFGSVFGSGSDGREGYGSGRDPEYGEGPYRGVGPKGFRRSPESLRERVCERMEDHDRLDASNIEVEVDDAEVTLKGEVEDRRTKRLAEECAESVPGVEDVHNRLTVKKREREGEQQTTSQKGSNGQSENRHEEHGG